MSTTTVKTNAEKIERARMLVENAKAKVDGLKNSINLKIQNNEDYSIEAEALKKAVEDYEMMQLQYHLYNILFADDDVKPILKLVEAFTWDCNTVKTQSDKTTKKVTAYIYAKKVVNYDLPFFAERYGESNNNKAGLNDVKAMDYLDELYYMIQGKQALRYGEPIRNTSIAKMHEEWKEDNSKPNPFSKSQISKAVTKVFEAFLGASPKLSTRIATEGNKEMPLVNFLIDSVISHVASKGEVKVHTVVRDTFARNFLQVMHFVLKDKNIAFVYDEEKEEKDVYKDVIEIEDKTNEAEAPAENVEATTEAPTNEAPAEAEAK